MRISRIVEVQDLSAPVVYPNKSDGQTDLALEAGVSYRDDGFTAIDNYSLDAELKLESVFRATVNPDPNAYLDVSKLETFGFLDISKQ